MFVPKNLSVEPVVNFPPRLAKEEPKTVVNLPRLAKEEPNVVNLPRLAKEEPNVVNFPPRLAKEEPNVVNFPPRLARMPRSKSVIKTHVLIEQGLPD